MLIFRIQYAPRTYSHNGDGIRRFLCQKYWRNRRWLIVKIWSLVNDAYFACDSFEVWPEQTVAHSEPQFNTGGAKTTSDSFLELLRNYGQFTERVGLIKGSYKNSLTKNLATKFVKENVKASLIAVYCNLYESYKSVFAWVDSFMQRGTVLYLDDLDTFRAQPDQGPKLAFKEYKEQTKWKFELFLPVASCSYSFIAC